MVSGALGGASRGVAARSNGRAKPTDALTLARSVPIEAESLREVVEQLAAIGSSALGFRTTGTQEDRDVAALVAAQMRAAGLADVAVEEVEVDSWRFEQASMSSGDFSAQGAALGGVPATPAGGVRGRLVDAGGAARRELDRLDVRGAIVLINWRKGPAGPSDIGLELGLRGAVGVVVAPARGGPYFQADDGLEARVASRMELAGAPFERITPLQTAALFPSMAVDDLAFSLYEPEAYVIRATAAVEALLDRARRGGARLVLDRALPAGPGSITLSDGPRSADRIVWACGAWLGALFPRDAPVRPSWQDVLHWNTPPAWRDGPAWFDERFNLYGFPDVDGLGIKAVTHGPGRSFDLEREARVPEQSMTGAVAEYIARRFPALAGAGLLWARVMPYEMTPDANFIAGPAELDGHWLLGGGSGHGFKHAPALGEHVADLLEGRADVVPMLRPGPRAAGPPAPR